MKIVLTIFALPQEIDDLEITVLQLKKAAKYLSGRHQWAMDITVATSDYLVDWQRSSLPRSFFFDKLKRLHVLTDWCAPHFQTSDSMRGSLVQKVYSYNRHADADIFIWLDPDIVFDERTLSFIEMAVEELKSSGLYVLTPEIVKMWDTTWDCIVNRDFLEKPFDYQKNNDPFSDAGIRGEIVLKEVVNNVPNQPRFKFGSGFFATMPRALFEAIPFPKTFGHYGLEDTFIMWAAEKLVRHRKAEIRQFKLEKLIVCEN